MKKIHKILALPITLLVAFILTGCGDKQEMSPTSESVTEKSEKDSSQEVTSETKAEQKLTLDTHRCVGCGKCARIAPSNFKMEGRKASVISQEKTESEDVQKAIKSCPVDIIKLT